SQAPTQPPAQDTGSSDSGLSLRRDAAEEAFRIQNDLIVQNGGTPLTWSETFYQQACQRAKEIVSDFSHDGFYNTTAYAENIAMGSYDANVMVQAWYNSDGHRSNMLYGWSYGAIACYGNYWVALFGPTEG
ncbi:MAG: CAP domain-containing protein, partial [Lachnospiraceae bacterium]|nr:CAP domain-containing protein [Lachnospiraceae bacterium]